MAIKDVLLELKRLAKDNGLSEPYIVGGLPRDKVLNRPHKVEDVDITSGDDSIHQLAELASSHYRINPMRFPDGHYQLYIDGTKYDFSTNFQSPDVVYFLNRAGLSDPTELQQELFSRDFTINTLTAPMGLRKIIDPTGMALKDIKNKQIRTPLPPRITLRDDPKRVVRAIYLAAKLGFTVEEDIIKWVRNNKEKIREGVSQGFAKKKLGAAIRADAKKTLDLLDLMDLWDTIGIPKAVMEAKTMGPAVMKKEQMLKSIQAIGKKAYFQGTSDPDKDKGEKDKATDKERQDRDTRDPNFFVEFKNYDYSDSDPSETSPGGGLYHGPMDKFKSVKDFIEDKRKKNKKKREKASKRMSIFVKIAKVIGK